MARLRGPVVRGRVVSLVRNKDAVCKTVVQPSGKISCRAVAVSDTFRVPEFIAQLFPATGVNRSAPIATLWSNYYPVFARSVRQGNLDKAFLEDLAVP